MSPLQRRLTPTERLHEVTMAAMTRRPSEPESSVTIGTTAKRIHTWEIVVRGEDVGECARRARLIDQTLAAHYAHELDSDTLAANLARSVVK